MRRVKFGQTRDSGASGGAQAIAANASPAGAADTGLGCSLPREGAGAMTEAKTRATAADVQAFITSRASPEQAADCAALTALMQRVTGEGPRMWGPSIVGFGSYRYRYESGRTGESCLVGFSIRGRELVVYLSGEHAEQEALLARLGKHRFGKACLYFKRLADLDGAVLEQLLAHSVAELRRRHTAG
jgi:hypothetical protein